MNSAESNVTLFRPNPTVFYLTNELIWVRLEQIRIIKNYLKMKKKNTHTYSFPFDQLCYMYINNLLDEYLQLKVHAYEMINIILNDLLS